MRIVVVSSLIFRVALLVCFSITVSWQATEIVVPEHEFPAYELYNQGVALQTKGDVGGAIAAYKKAIELKADLFEAYNNLGFLYGVIGDKVAAMEMYRTAVHVTDGKDPRAADALSNLGNSIHTQAKKNFLAIEEAMGYFEAALAADPGHAEATFNLGKAFEDLGQVAEAALWYERALGLRARHPHAQMNLANLRLGAGDAAGATALLEDLLQEGGLEPKTRKEVLCNLGQARRQQGDHAAALRAFAEARDLMPDAPTAAYFVLLAARTLCRWEELEGLEDEALRAARAQLRLLAAAAPLPAGGAAAAAAAAIEEEAGRAALTPYEGCLVAGLSGAEARGVAALYTWAWRASPRIRLEDPPNPLALKNGTEKLTIGYFSYDYRDHPMGHLTGALVAGPGPGPGGARGAVRTAAVSYGADDGSAWRRRAEAGADAFVDLAQVGDRAAAPGLARLRLAVAVDLMAHTKGARPGLLALRPAAATVNYLGYPGTMGSLHDYAMVDRICVPPESADDFTEKLIYLPHTYQANDYNASTPLCPLGGGACQGRVKTEALGLPADTAVACNFNTLDKMEPHSWRLWARVLRRAAAALGGWARVALVLLQPSPGVAEEVQARLWAEAAAAGVPPGRVRFLARAPKDEHVARVTGCDLFLDGLVYGAHSTAADVLWAGVPLVTVAGWGGRGGGAGVPGRMPARVAAALVQALGGKEEEEGGGTAAAAAARALVAGGLREAEDLAVRLMAEPALRDKIRRAITGSLLQAPLFNQRSTNWKVERAYQVLWEIHHQKDTSESVLPESNKDDLHHLFVAPALPADFGALVAFQATTALAADCLERGDPACAGAAAERAAAAAAAGGGAPDQAAAAEAWHLAGLAAHQAGKSKQLGVARVERSVALAPADRLSQYQGNLGHVLFAAGDFDGAAVAFTQAWRLDLTNMELALALQRSLLKAEDFDGENSFWQEGGAALAMEHQENAMAQDQGAQVELLQNHASALALAAAPGAEGQVAATLGAAASLAPHNPEVQLRYGAALQGTQNFELALEVMLDAVREMNKQDFASFGRSVPKSPRPLGTTPTVAIYCYEYGQTWWPNWGPSSLITGGLGGSEEAVVFISREMARLGYHVEIYNEALPQEWGRDEYGVYWYPYQSYDTSAPPDYFVGWRYHISMALSSTAGGRFLWLQDKPPYETYLPKFISDLSGIFALSDYHVRTFPQHAQPKGVVTPNGIDPEFLEDGPNSPNVFVYGSAPDRGLEMLLLCWPQIREGLAIAAPGTKAKLEVYYGFSKSFLVHAANTIPDHKAWISRMETLLKQEGIVYRGMVDHSTLASAYASAGFILYPTIFPETGCVTLMKAQAMGAVPITSRFEGSTLPELTQHWDLGPRPLVGHYANDPEWQSLWVDRVIAAATRDIRERQGSKQTHREDEVRPSFDDGEGESSKVPLPLAPGAATVQQHREQMKDWARRRFLWEHVARQWHSAFQLVLQKGETRAGGGG